MHIKTIGILFFLNEKKIGLKDTGYWYWGNSTFRLKNCRWYFSPQWTVMVVLVQLKCASSNLVVLVYQNLITIETFNPCQCQYKGRLFKQLGCNGYDWDSQTLMSSTLVPFGPRKIAINICENGPVRLQITRTTI